MIIKLELNAMQFAMSSYSLHLSIWGSPINSPTLGFYFYFLKEPTLGFSFLFLELMQCNSLGLLILCMYLSYVSQPIQHIYLFYMEEYLSNSHKAKLLMFSKTLGPVQFPQVLLSFFLFLFSIMKLKHACILSQKKKKKKNAFIHFLNLKPEKRTQSETRVPQSVSKIVQLPPYVFEISFLLRASSSYLITTTLKYMHF